MMVIIQMLKKKPVLQLVWHVKIIVSSALIIPFVLNAMNQRLFGMRRQSFAKVSAKMDNIIIHQTYNVLLVKCKIVMFATELDLNVINAIMDIHQFKNKKTPIFVKRYLLLLKVLKFFLILSLCCVELYCFSLNFDVSINHSLI